MNCVSKAKSPLRSHARAFTLLEVMVVVAVIGLIGIISIPAIRSATHREALSQAIVDVTEACYKARARAIMQGSPAELHIHLADRTIEVGDAPADPASNPEYDFGPKPEAVTQPAKSATADKTPGFSARLSDDLVIDMLDVNLVEYKEAPDARIKFFPNGTSDEFTFIIHTAGGESRKIWLEVVTALPDVGPVR